MPEQKPCEPRAVKRRLGHGARHRQNLFTVLGLLLDLAGEQSQGVWEAIRNQVGVRQCEDLQNALVVRWDLSKPGHLLVTSARRDPVRRDDPSISGSTSQKGTLEAIRLCLEKANRPLNIDGRNSNTRIDNFQTNQIRDALSHLHGLQLREDDPMAGRSAKGKRAESPARDNNPYYSFWVDFSSVGSMQADQCLGLVDRLWREKFEDKRPSVRPSTSGDPGLKLKAELDAWVGANLENWRVRFEALDDVKDRQIHVPLKTAIRLAFVTVEQPPPESAPRELKPEDLKAVVAAPGSQLLLIWEEGGAGKTSLAFQIARWGMAGLLADHPLLPVLLDPAIGDGNVVERLHRQLSHLGAPELTPDFVRDLLRHRRLLPIVDHISELSDHQRQWLRDNLPPHLVLLTSRRRESSLFSGWSISEIQPQRLEGEALFDFFEAYLEAKAKAEPAGACSPAPLLSAEDQIRTRDLLERMVGNKPITVLLVCLVIDKALDHIASGRMELLPSSVPDLMLDYVERSSKSIAPDELCLADGTPLTPHRIVDSLKLLALAAHRQDNEAFRPQHFGLELALQALRQTSLDGRQQSSEEQLRGLLVYMQHNLNLLQHKGGSVRDPMYRVALDPLADYMAALALMDECNGGPVTPASLEDRAHHQRVQQWLDQLDKRLEREKGDAGALMCGFLAACRDGYRQLLARALSSLDPALRQSWDGIPHTFARLAGIDPQQERRLEVRHLIRRHAQDLFWSNPELLPKAIAELSAFAREFAGGRELDQAIVPLACAMAKPTLPEPVRTAAAEALGLIGGEEAAKALVRMIKTMEEPCLAVRRAAAEALGLVDAPAEDPCAHWTRLKALLADESHHLHGDRFDAMEAKLPLLQGAARGLQRLAARSSPFPLPIWGSGPGLQLPMLTLTTVRGTVTTRLVELPVWQVPLPGGLPLELVQIPGGHTIIGSSPEPEEEGRSLYDHRPDAADVEVEEQRAVAVPAFAMARFPITAAQWRTLAGADLQRQGGRELKPDPSQHKGADLPVQCVSWYDCQEWIQRLNRWLAQDWSEQRRQGEPPRLGLPSESLWEVACRGGTTTPFHFGDTLDATWANYDANYRYACGRERSEDYLQRPSAVGAYGLVNDWGLADLHGNVWEWCADHWHASPLGGPPDGQPWEDPAEGGGTRLRLLRGGSWFNVPRFCRSAYRLSIHPSLLDVNVGFRVCCLPPGSPSWPSNP